MKIKAKYKILFVCLFHIVVTDVKNKTWRYLKLKKFSLFFLTLLLVVVPFLPTFANESKEEVTVDIVPIGELGAGEVIQPMAGNGKWDSVGYSAILQHSSNTGFKNITNYKHSTGGDFMFCIHNSAFDKNQKVGYQDQVQICV